ncbi:hypothetical protein FNV43_RR00083 [Rhamnella rubrinervis]|uniref:Uncharacterized protein n=1 Tax=Rhamnella rubrinervis TaxID=2594499 RepID=A0A8K0HMY2_9ROSA|nr:hypothetical protein FNV43_RR00083 [Rhamnella rubrinervis]
MFRWAWFNPCDWSEEIDPRLRSVLDVESSHGEQEHGLHTTARFGGPPDGEEDPEEVVEDLKEDSMGTDDYIPHGYTPEQRDPKDFDPWDESASD